VSDRDDVSDGNGDGRLRVAGWAWYWRAERLAGDGGRGQPTSSRRRAVQVHVYTAYRHWLGAVMGISAAF